MVDMPYNQTKPNQIKPKYTAYVVVLVLEMLVVGEFCFNAATPGPLLSGLVVHLRVPQIGQIDLFKIIRIPWDKEQKI